jgi:phosphoribosyl 1,2-cyclic phosphodiesterase
MRIISLQSGSSGNAIYVESNGFQLLLDAGITGRQAQLRLEAFGRDIGDVDAVVISHDHRDHARYLGVYQRKFGLPVYVTRRTLDAAARYCQLGRLGDVRHFCAGDTLRCGTLAVRTIRTPHDGADGVAFVVDDGAKRVGVLTDLGHVFDDLRRVVPTLDGILLESNYDPAMLADGPYPEFLRRRIRGYRGHLSNSDAAGLLAQAAGTRLKWVCLAHLSEENNRPELARETLVRAVGHRFPIYVASRSEPTGVFEV